MGRVGSREVAVEFTWTNEQFTSSAVATSAYVGGLVRDCVTVSKWHEWPVDTPPRRTGDHRSRPFRSAAHPYSRCQLRPVRAPASDLYRGHPIIGSIKAHADQSYASRPTGQPDSAAAGAGWISGPLSRFTSHRFLSCQRRDRGPRVRLWRMHTGCRAIEGNPVGASALQDSHVSVAVLNVPTVAQSDVHTSGVGSNRPPSAVASTCGDGQPLPCITLGRAGVIPPM